MAQALLAATCVIAPMPARAQMMPGSQSAAEIAARDPVAAVSASLGSARALNRRAGTIVAARGRATPTTIARLQLSTRPAAMAPNAPPRCYVLLAVASAVTDVSTTIRADRTVISQGFSISASAANGVRSTRFCVAASATRIEASATSTTNSQWAAALIEAPPEATAIVEMSTVGLSTRERLAAALAANSGQSAGTQGRATSEAARIEIGGRELDFVGRELREAYGAVRGARAVTEAVRAQLQTAQEREVRAPLEEGRCYEAAAFAVPSVTDIDVSWIDPSGVRVAQDRGHQPSERLRFCPRFSGTHRAIARVFSGSGALVLQVIEVPAS